MPERCPECKSASIRQVGIGTETVEKTLRSLLPKARILRWDADSRRDQKLSDLVLTHFRNHQYDILIGTQMVSKGLDFPLVQTVGMVLADVGLNLPDYRSPERVFQLLTQVAGRAGRTAADGRVILQTYQPDHYAIQSASRHDFKTFYEQEMEYRQMPGYPPFARIIRIEDHDADEGQVRGRLEDLAVEIRGWLEAAGQYHTEILGPLPCFFNRQNDIYRWQIILRGADPLPVLRRKVEHLADFKVEVNPPNLL
jgi:primosomal protein N' (replication factor Y) (superfamily II helicase)